MTWDYEHPDDYGSADDNPALTRRALCAKAEELAVEMVRWKVWRVEGNARASLREAQAMQALIMVLIELLDDTQGSPAAVQAELTRAVSLLGYTLGAEPETEAERRDDAAFLRMYKLRFSDETSPPEDLEPPS